MTLASSHLVRIQICGALAVERDGQRLDARLPGRQGRLLFTHLVVNRHRHIPRDELAEALWREPDPAAVDARLNPLQSKLRRVFGADAVDGRSTLRLCLRDAWVDLDAAAEAILRAESSVAQHRLCRACITNWPFRLIWAGYCALLSSELRRRAAAGVANVDGTAGIAAGPAMVRTAPSASACIRRGPPLASPLGSR